MGRGGGKARTTDRALHTAGAALGRVEQKGLATGDPKTHRSTRWGPLTGSLLRHALLRAAVTPGAPPYRLSSLSLSMIQMHWPLWLLSPLTAPKVRTPSGLASAAGQPSRAL